ncbi:Putrescine transport system permease protein PotH [Novosphingobium resinovorum]|uniref:Putrescine transport system permease protein PotH n=1 Tax=Novosphingobium resinovorum TaxID=158500 RepID=A0A031K5Q3_9SPHN|nr:MULTISPECIES: hypothetical protein [Novosphingobium]EZP83927.1 Putrescine transport system permease protein PotH [Novosphingobium resinovorum]
MGQNGSSVGRMASRPATVASGLVLLGFGTVPLVAAVIGSFRPLNGDANQVSLAGYAVLLAGPRIVEIAQVIERTAAATVIALLLGVPAAYFLKQLRSSRLQLLALALLLTPWLVSDMLRAFGWQLALSPNGIVSTLWSVVFGAPLEGLRYNHGAALLGLVASTLPISVLATFAALPRSGSSEWLAARELGGPDHVFRVMALGQARLGIAFGACMTFLLCLFASAEPQMLDGPTRTSTFTIAASLSNVGVSALMAFGVVMLLVTASMFAALVFAWLAYHRPRAQPLPLDIVLPPNGQCQGLRRPRRGLADRAVILVPPLCCCIAVLLCLCPLAALGLEALRQPSAAGDSWGFEAFRLFASSPDLIAALSRSAVLAVAVAMLAAAGGFAMSMTIWNPARARIVLLSMVILALLPGEVYALGLLQVAKAAGWAQGAPFLVAIAHLIWIIPFTTGSLMIANTAIGRSVIEAALELGSPPTLVATKFVGRINWGAVVAAILLSFTLSLNENTRASYLGGSEPSLANDVFGRLQAGLLPENRGIFAIELMLVAAALVSAAVILEVLFRASRERTGG